MEGGEMEIRRVKHNLLIKWQDSNETGDSGVLGLCTCLVLKWVGRGGVGFGL